MDGIAAFGVWGKMMPFKSILDIYKKSILKKDTFYISFSCRINGSGKETLEIKIGQELCEKYNLRFTQKVDLFFDKDTCKGLIKKSDTKGLKVRPTGVSASKRNDVDYYTLGITIAYFVGMPKIAKTGRCCNIRINQDYLYFDFPSAVFFED